ncbi:MAG: glutathione S-transferase family protein [Gammaproteobacteria bacterium]
MKFFDAPPAPSPRRVRMFIAEKGLAIDTVILDLRQHEQLNEEFKAKNPRCTVPVLELDDGTCLTETLSICHYLESLHPEPNLLGDDAKEQALVLMWNDIIMFNGFAAAGEALRNFAKMFNNRSVTGPENYPQIPQLADRGRLRTEHFLTELNERLADSEYVAIERFSMADITAYVCIEFAGWIKVPIKDDQPHLRRWFDAVASRPSASA